LLYCFRPLTLYETIEKLSSISDEVKSYTSFRKTWGRGRGEHKGDDKDELKKSGERHRRRGKTQMI
jgi:hypothetical protein